MAEVLIKQQLRADKCGHASNQLTANLRRLAGQDGLRELRERPRGAGCERIWEL